MARIEKRGVARFAESAFMVESFLSTGVKKKGEWQSSRPIHPRSSGHSRAEFLVVNNL
jgi:hypothetical protein